MKDAAERIVSEGKSVLLSQLADRVGNVVVGGETTASVNLVAATMVNRPMSSVDEPVVTSNENELIVVEDEDLFEMKESTERIEMKSGLCNDMDIREWKLCECKRLVELVVGDECVEYVSELKLVGLKCLEKMKIGMNCFSKSEGGCLEVSECEQLKSVKLGDGCCVNWSSFTLKNCEALQEVSIGDGGFVSCESTVFESKRGLNRVMTRLG